VLHDRQETNATWQHTTACHATRWTKHALAHAAASLHSQATHPFTTGPGCIIP
jgi:hypothetical protein